MVPFISASRAILRVVLGNVDQMLSGDLFAISARRVSRDPDAILREKRLKKWRRARKLELIERHNPQWRDLYDELM